MTVKIRRAATVEDIVGYSPTLKRDAHRLSESLKRIVESQETDKRGKP
jgi:hypothetical protein